MFQRFRSRDVFRPYVHSTRPVGMAFWSCSIVVQVLPRFRYVGYHSVSPPSHISLSNAAILAACAALRAAKYFLTLLARTLRAASTRLKAARALGVCHHLLSWFSVSLTRYHSTCTFAFMLKRAVLREGLTSLRMRKISEKSVWSVFSIFVVVDKIGRFLLALLGLPITQIYQLLQTHRDDNHALTIPCVVRSLVARPFCVRVAPPLNAFTFRVDHDMTNFCSHLPYVIAAYVCGHSPVQPAASFERAQKVLDMQVYPIESTCETWYCANEPKTAIYRLLFGPGERVCPLLCAVGQLDCDAL